MRILLIAVASIILSVAAQFFLKAGILNMEIKQAMFKPLTLRLLW